MCDVIHCGPCGEKRHTLRIGGMLSLVASEKLALYNKRDEKCSTLEDETPLSFENQSTDITTDYMSSSDR